jgi:superfamily I DNA and/or RNA helicase
MDVSVQVKVNGHLTFTDPDYNTGWNINVTPSGLIDNKYDYLFYEADLKKIELPNEGWVVEYGNLKTWFDEYLPKLGLNQKEKEQFEEYWMGKLRIANYYDIRILDNKFLSENMDLIINPNPETLLRLNFYFQPLSAKTELTAPEIKEVTRNGFTVVEWGGINGGDLRLVP